ncbi:hypothetical protein [Idiomarina aminovorans]|uniref:hypothetical protein n=1 Tax=Idiomarina aminovorans TaxID=2914829 RepID=UPI002004711E|nr:hypothetical protein [Idiomarina sp. ATCH4]MCK7460488.1 hypothetical protein [Idiomarina sp. ATCH4]
MEFIDLFSLLGPLVLLAVILMFRSERLSTPKHIFQNAGDDMLILHTPIARFFPSLGKSIKKSQVARIQKADGTVTVFNQSSNAIDIPLSKKHAGPVFNHAISLFPSAEVVEIER